MAIDSLEKKDTNLENPIPIPISISNCGTFYIKMP